MRKFFQNVVKKVTGVTISESALKWVGRLFGVALLVLCYYIGFVSGTPDNDPFNVGNIYEALHPLKTNDIAGCILLAAGVCWLTGIVELFIGEISVPVGSVWPNYAGFIAVLAGLLLIWL